MSSDLCLGDIAEITMGQSPSGENCNSVGLGLPLLNGPTEFGTKHPYPVQFTSESKKLAKAGDLLFCVRGSTTGKMNWADQTYVIGRGIASIRGKNGFPNSFIRAAIESNLDNLLVQATGSTFPNVSRDLIASLTIPKTSPEEAVEIATIIEPIDDRIALLRDSNATLEAIAQAMFKSWFVDFDPVHAKQQGRAPEGMSEATAALFPDRFKESELGLVPRGWRCTTLNDAYEINPQRKLKKGEIAPYLDMANAPTSGHSAESVVQREMGSGSKFTNGDTLLARITPCLENGKTAFVDFLSADQNGWGSTEFVVLRPRKPLPEYHAYLLARHKSFRDFSIQSMSGTSGRQRIQNDVLGNYLLVLPTEDVAIAFGDIATPIQQRITANNAQAQTLATLRDTLLPRLISGQLRLPDLEGAVQ